MKAKVIYAPEKYDKWYRKTRIFLAGSIEMGAAENWQDKVIAALADYNVEIFNPRRPDWDSSCVQSIHNKQFNEQVNWELDALDDTDIIAMYFDPNTKSPITLLEFGLFAYSDKEITLCCPEGFWRKGNVDIVAKRADIVQVNTLEELIKDLKSILDDE